MTEFGTLSSEQQVNWLTQMVASNLGEWGISDCTPRLIKYRENAVFEVRLASGERAALRVHRQGYHSFEALLSELKWMAFLAQGGVVVPRPIPTKGGELVFRDDSNVRFGIWHLDLLSWLDGTMLGVVGEPLNIPSGDRVRLFTEIGRSIALLHNSSSSWEEQNAQPRHSWDREALVGDQPFWGRFWELEALTDQLRQLFVSMRDVIGKALDLYGKTSKNYGLIHADLVPENILIDGEAVQFIDFDDAGFGWHMFEIATALYWLREEPDYPLIESSLLQGYQEYRTLEKRDLAALELFFVIRSTTYLSWVHSRQNSEVACELTPIAVSQAESLCRDYLGKL